MKKVRNNSWKGIFTELRDRLLNAIKSASFVVYFLIGVLVVGGIGVWLPFIFDSSDEVSLLESQHIFTYTVAILSTLFIEGFLEPTRNKSLSAIGLLVGASSFFLCLYGYYQNQIGVSYIVNIGAVLALLIFVIAKANDEKFDDEADVISGATGFNEASANNIKDR